MDNLLSKVPPQNKQAEDSVLSSLFINNTGFENIEGLKPDDFYNFANQKVFSSMLSLKKIGKPVDLLTVMLDLTANEELESIGGAGYLAEISDAAPVAVNIGHYSKIVQDLAVVRKLIQVASSIVERGFTAKDVEKYISDSQSKILDIQTSTSKDQFYTMDSLMQDTIDRIEEAQTAEQQIGLYLGMPKLDYHMQVWGSKLILLAGRPGMGKTSLALSIAVKLAYQGDAVGMLSIEMDKEQFADKMVSVEANINSMNFYIRNQLDQTDIRNIGIAADSLSSIPIHMDDSECDLEDVKRKCRKLKKLGCKIIMIDQLSQIGYDKGLKPYVGISKNCTAIKQLTKELRIPILLMCQLNRNVEARNEKRPNLGDLAETGRLEQDADIILFLFREGYYDENIDESRTEIILAKNRQGGKAVEKQVLFKRNRGMFELL